MFLLVGLWCTIMVVVVVMVVVVMPIQKESQK